MRHDERSGGGRRGPPGGPRGRPRGPRRPAGAVPRPRRAPAGPPPPRNSRAAAGRILADWLAGGAFPDHALERVERDHAFVMEVVFGVVRWFGPLDWILRQLTRHPPPPPVSALCHVGFYQLLYLDQVAEFAAVHETVEAARDAGGERGAALVNALLRRVQREAAEIRDGLTRQPEHVRLSHPLVMLQRWRRLYGQRTMLQLCEWNNRRPRVTVRVDAMRTPLEALLARFREAGVAAEPHPFAPAAFLTLPHGAPVRGLPGFAEGAFHVQDPATSAAVDLLDPRPGERILDACAAPGGKTLALFERMRGEGVLAAMDRREERLEPLRDNLRRAGARQVAVGTGDATRLSLDRFSDLPGVQDGFDGILLDVPCTNTGVIRRRPDVRWNWSEMRLARLAGLQEALLDAAAPCVKPGGRVVYSTCSLEPEENELRVASWLARHPGFRRTKARKLLPPKTRTDGAYAACLVKAAG